MISKISAYLRGMVEFRTGFAMHYNWELLHYYDMGRDLMHKLTLRKFEW